MSATKFTRGMKVQLPDGRIGAVQWYGKPGKNGIVKSSRKKANESGNPHVYLWFHNKDYTVESWEWIPIDELRRY